MATTQKARQGNDATNTGHEAEYWRMADTLRGSMDAAEYTSGLSFLEFFQTDKDTGRTKGIIAIDLGGLA